MKLLKKLTAGLACVTLVGGLALSAGQADASTVMITFDSATGGGPNSSWNEGGFTFAPANANGSQHCYEPNCLLEFNNGAITTATNDAGLPFSLDSFYFSLTGNAAQGSNMINVAGYSGDTLVNEYSFLLGSTYSNVFFAESGDAAGALAINTGYFAYFTTMTNLTRVVWTAATSGQTRLDNVGFTPIPLPAPALLLLGGLAGIGFVGRRRNKQAA